MIWPDCLLKNSKGLQSLFYLTWRGQVMTVEFLRKLIYLTPRCHHQKVLGCFKFSFLWCVREVYFFILTTKWTGHHGDFAILTGELGNLLICTPRCHANREVSQKFELFGKIETVFENCLTSCFFLGGGGLSLGWWWRNLWHIIFIYEKHDFNS